MLVLWTGWPGSSQLIDDIVLHPPGDVGRELRDRLGALQAARVLAEPSGDHQTILLLLKVKIDRMKALSGRSDPVAISDDARWLADRGSRLDVCDNEAESRLRSL